MSTGQQQQQKPGPTMNDYLGWLYWLCDVYRCIPGPFLRYGQGAQAYDLRAAAALLVMFTLAAAERDGGLLLFLGVWLVALAYRRFQGFRLRQKGVMIHSRYAGEAWLAMQVPFVRSERTATGIIEPTICLLAGAMLCPLSVNLGALLMVGWLVLLVRDGIEREIDRKRLERMRDAEIEAAWYGDRFRRGE